MLICVLYLVCPCTARPDFLASCQVVFSRPVPKGPLHLALNNHNRRVYDVLACLNKDYEVCLLNEVLSDGVWDVDSCAGSLV